RRAFLLALLPVIAWLLCAAPVTAAGDDPVRQWGAETLARIQADLWLPARGLYAEAAEAGHPPPDRPAFMWGCGVQLSALAAAARVDRASVPDLERYEEALRAYWVDHDGIGGFDV